MKKPMTFFKVLTVILALSAIISCGKDDSTTMDCGFAAVMASNENFEAAVAAYSADQSDANCEALQSAIADFNSNAENVDVECLNASDAANFVGWGIAVATTAPC